MPAARVITPALEQQLVEAFERGSTQRDACALAHLPFRTFKAWLQKGAQGHEVYVAFEAHIRAAEARWSNGLLEEAQLASAEGRDPKLQMWLLEKRRWKDYDPKARAAHEANKLAREANLAALNDEQLGDAFIQMAKSQAKADPTFLERLRAAIEQTGPDDERVEDPTVPSE